MLGRTPTKAEKAWIDVVAQVGCIACITFDHRNEAFGEGYCEIHHLNGSVKVDCHLRTVGLCDKHHRIADNQTPKRWVSLHGDGRAAFEKAYCAEPELLVVQKTMNTMFKKVAEIG